MMSANPSTSLPPEITELAIRLGAAAADSARARVHLARSGEMREGPEKRWMRFTATETVDVTAPGFDWRAKTGPLSCLTVVDRLSGEDARSELRLFGLLPLSGSPPDRTALHKGQIMRYLAVNPVVSGRDCPKQNVGMDRPEQWIARQPSLGLRPVLGGHRVRRRRPHRPGVGARQAAAGERALCGAPMAGPLHRLPPALRPMDPWPGSRLGDRWRLEHRLARPTHWMEHLNSRLSCRNRCGRLIF